MTGMKVESEDKKAYQFERFICERVSTLTFVMSWWRDFRIGRNVMKFQEFW